MPVPIEEVALGILQGYSPALNLIIRWEHGRLTWWDPHTEAPILSYEDQRGRADQADARAEAEREARIQAEERAQRMEEELRWLRGEELP